MTKEERIEILKKLNTQLDGVNAYLRQLEQGEGNKRWHSLASAKGALEVLRSFVEWYESDTKERD